jgi:nitrate reductase gamma subunit
MVLTHTEWIAGVVFLAGSLLLAVNRAVRRHIKRTSG